MFGVKWSVGNAGGQTVGRSDGQTGGQADGRAVGPSDGRSDGQMVGIQYVGRSETTHGRSDDRTVVRFDQVF